MQRTTGLSEPEQQAAGSILIIRIVFNNSGLRSNLSDFSIADMRSIARLKAWRLNSNSPADSWRRMSSRVFI